MKHPYRAFELHCHTRHSDGSFAPDALCHAAKGRGYDGIALTDHNTMAGIQDITPELIQAALPVIPGMEWTTFYGHMLVMDPERHIDWRFAQPGDIDRYLVKIREAGGATGIAHPFSVGSPMRTGAYWNFNVQNWELIDYIEVWSGGFPSLNPINDDAMQMWTNLLNRGCRLAATSGRDWHGPDDPEAGPVHQAATYLRITDGRISAHEVKKALTKGRSYVTSGPGLSFIVSGNGVTADIGDEVPCGSVRIHYAVDETIRFDQWKHFGIRARNAVIVHNGMPVASVPCDGACKGELTLETVPGWVRLEVFGDFMNEANQLLAFTSPVYLTV